MEYLESKDQLRSFLKNPPIVNNQYKVKRFCKLSTGSNLKEKYINCLKPGEEIKVKWNYEDINNPVCETIKINDNEHTVYWKSGKFSDWLQKNTRKI